MRTNTARYGIILNTEHYERCVEFYRDLFELPVMFERSDDGFRLTCLAYGDGYLMIEEEGTAKAGGKSIAEGTFKLRFNVQDMDEALAAVRAWGIDASISENSWGRTINIYDPDGNRVGIRDEPGFVQQIRDGSTTVA